MNKNSKEKRNKMTPADVKAVIQSVRGEITKSEKTGWKNNGWLKN